MHLQQRSVVRYYLLGKKSNMAIQAKFGLVYGKDDLCQRTVDTPAARFRSGRILVEEDERSGRPSSESLLYCSTKKEITIRWVHHSASMFGVCSNTVRSLATWADDPHSFEHQAERLSISSRSRRQVCPGPRVHRAVFHAHGFVYRT
jgi:hypothetical protein